jgi:hypothetical protein
MSFERAREEINRFLESTRPEVLCVSGGWGVGKTFMWNKCLRDARDKRKVGLKRYAYLSLFGQNSLEDLKYATFENTVDLDQFEGGPDFKSLNSAFSTAKKIARPMLRYSNLLPIGEALSTVALKSAFLAVRKQVVCFDDLERAGAGLQIQDVLGLVLLLKEQRSCKVVLLLNHSMLQDSERSAFDKQLEKVADTHISLSPTPAEVAALGIGKEYWFRDSLFEDCVSLGITNFRVVTKILQSCARLEQIFKEHDGAIFRAAIHTITLFGWARYQPDLAPPVSFLLARKPFQTQEDRKADVAGNEARWGAILKAYEFTFADRFDRLLMHGLEHGYFDSEQLQKEATDMQRVIEREKKDKSFSDAWDLFHGSFGTTADEVLDKLSSAFRRNVDIVTPINLSGTVAVFKELGRTAEAKELLEFYMKNRREEKEFYALDHIREYVRDPDVLAAFKARFDSFGDEMTPKDILLKIAAQSGWNPEDVARLVEVSESDFGKMFMAASGKELRSLIQAALRFGTLGGVSKEMTAISDRATAALRQIGRQSAINKMRVRSYGISFDPVD